MISKATHNKITLVNNQDEIYFEKNHSQDKKVRVQFFSNGNQGNYVVFNPIKDGYMRLFDLKGNLLTSPSLPSSHPIEMYNLSKSKQQEIYLIDGTTLFTYSKP